MIIITGYVNETIEKAARATGIAELIIKPINAYQLTDAIQRVLAKAIV
jgi:CheY-like chemotaxis protein